jgi:hypothetical protein
MGPGILVDIAGTTLWVLGKDLAAGNEFESGITDELATARRGVGQGEEQSPMSKGRSLTRECDMQLS